jgi:hypothetical protein
MYAKEYIVAKQAELKDENSVGLTVIAFYQQNEIKALMASSRPEDLTKLAEELYVLLNAINQYSSEDHKKAAFDCIAQLKKVEKKIPSDYINFNSALANNDISYCQNLINANLILSKFTWTELNLAEKYGPTVDTEPRYISINKFLSESIPAVNQIISNSKNIEEIDNAYKQLNEFPIPFTFRQEIMGKLQNINKKYVDRQVTLLKSTTQHSEVELYKYHNNPALYLEIIAKYEKLYEKLKDIKNNADEKTVAAINQVLESKERWQREYVQNISPSKENNEALLKVCTDLKQKFQEQANDKKDFSIQYLALFTEVDVYLEKLKNASGTEKYELYNKLAESYNALDALYKSNKTYLATFSDHYRQYKNRGDLVFSKQVESYEKMAKASQEAQRSATSILILTSYNPTNYMSELKPLSDPIIEKLKETVQKHNVYQNHPQKNSAVQNMLDILDNNELSTENKLNQLSNYLNSKDENIQAFKATTWRSTEFSKKYNEISSALQDAQSALAKTESAELKNK